MDTGFESFVSGGFGMYPILVTGIVATVASIRYAIDTEPIRLRFVKALSSVLGALMLFWGVLGVVSILKGMALDAQPERSAAMATGIATIVNTWALGLLILVLVSTAVAVGVYRSGRRELRALVP